jgi:TPR repeat protein
LGLSQFNLKEPTDAFASLERAAALGSAQSHANLAFLHLSGGRLEKSIEHLTQAYNKGVFADFPEVLPLLSYWGIGTPQVKGTEG